MKLGKRSEKWVNLGKSQNPENYYTYTGDSQAFLICIKPNIARVLVKSPQTHWPLRTSEGGARLNARMENPVLIFDNTIEDWWASSYLDLL